MPTPDPSDEPSDAPDPVRPSEADDAASLRAALEAERAGAEHWRRVARQSEGALGELKRRTSIRALLSAERRTAPLRRGAGLAGHRVRAGIERASVAASALSSRPARRAREAALDAARQRGGAVPTDPRSALVVVIGATDPPAWAIALPRPRVTVVSTGTAPTGAIAAARQATSGSRADLVCLVAATTEPITPDWLDRLAAPLTGGVVATTGVLIHPARPATSATEHDLLVRSAGLDVEVEPTGAPRLTAIDAGRGPGEVGGGPVVAATSGWVLVDRQALAACGGLADLGGLAGLDASVIDLCVRLRAAGGSVVCVPGALAFDHRPVPRARELLHPVPAEGAAWRALVGRAGPALVRWADDGAIEPEGSGGGLRIAITVASPSAKVAERWGDWHLAEALGRALQDQGHRATVQTFADADSPASRSHDVHLVLRGLARVARTPGQRHVLWVISHPEDLDAAELDAADLVLVASERFAANLRTRTDTPVEVLLQATDPHRFRPMPVDPRHRHPVTIVARSRDVLRPMVRDALAAGLRPAIYGTGWEGLVDPALVVADHVANADLPVVYSSAGVVLNDHWDTMRTWGFVSNRIFDVVACGTPLVSDHLPEVEALFGDLVPTSRNADDLARVVASMVDDPEATRDRAKRARDLVLDRHTFARRAAELVEALQRHDLGRRG